MEQKKLSEMSEPELRHEIQGYKEKMRKAEMNGIYNGSNNYFKVERLKGVFAWGFRINSSEPEEGLPVALLKL